MDEFRHALTKAARVSGWVLAVPLAFVSMANQSTAKGLMEKRPWTVRDSVELRYFVDPDNPRLQIWSNHPITASPDGRRFAVLSRRGDLENDETVYELSIFDTMAVSQAISSSRTLPRPLQRIQMRSNNYIPGISNIRWAPDGESLLFLGTDSSPAARASVSTLDIHSVVYRLDLLGGAVTPLCTCGFPEDDAKSNLVDASGDVVLFVDGKLAEKKQFRANYPSQVWTGQRLYGFAFGGDIDVRVKPALYLSVRGKSRKIATLDGFDAGSPDGVVARISPRADLAIVALPLDPARSEKFANYDFADVIKASGQSRQLTSTTTPTQFFRLDVATAKVEPLFDAPTGSLTKMGQETKLVDVIWSRDGEEALLVNTALPSTVTDNAYDTAWVASYDVGSRDVHPVAPMRQGDLKVSSAHWSNDRGKVVLDFTSRDTPGKSVSKTFAFVDHSWTQVSDLPRTDNPNSILWNAPASDVDLIYAEAKRRRDELGPGSWIDPPLARPFVFSNGLRLTLRESMNEPQRLIASVGRRERTLIEAEPWLKDVAIAPSQVFRWKSVDGNVHRATLTLPLRPTNSLPPLVIMVGNYTPNLFRPDGRLLAGYARQLYAARGMAVIEIGEFDSSIYSSSAGSPGGEPRNAGEVTRNRDLVETLLDAIRDRRLADTTRVGAMGFSHTGFLARQLLLDSGRYKLRAVVANDSFASSISDFFKEVAMYGDMAVAPWPSTESVPMRSAIMHGGSYWSSTTQWQREAMDLAAVRATGALLEIDHGGTGAFGTAFLFSSRYGSFRSAMRPIEFIELPNAGHQLVNPAQIAEAINLNVDWMNFWLQGNERKEPLEAIGETTRILEDKYLRWRKLKSEWTKQQAWEAAGNRPGSVPGDTSNEGKGAH